MFGYTKRNKKREDMRDRLLCNTAAGLAHLLSLTMDSSKNKSDVVTSAHFVKRLTADATELLTVTYRGDT